MPSKNFQNGFNNALHAMMKRAARDWEGMPGRPGGPALPAAPAKAQPTDRGVFTPQFGASNLFPSGNYFEDVAKVTPLTAIKDSVVDGAADTAKTVYETAKSLGHAAKGVGNVVANAALEGKYDPNNSVLFGYSDPRRRAFVWDSAVAAPAAGVDALAGNIVNGVSRVADIPIKALGYDGIADDVETNNRTSHNALRDSVYWDSANKNSEDFRDAEDVYSEAAQLAADYYSGGASRWLQLAVETAAQAGKNPSYSTTHDKYGINTSTDNHENTVKDLFTGAKFLYPWGANLAGGRLPQLPGWLLEATPGTLVGEGLGSAYDYSDTHNASKEVLDNQRKRVGSMTMFADAINTQNDIQSYIDSLMSGDTEAAEEIKKRRPELFGDDGTLDSLKINEVRKRFADAGVPEQLIREGEFGFYPVDPELVGLANDFADASIVEKQDVASDLDNRMKTDLITAYSFGGMAAAEQILAVLPAAQRLGAMKWLSGVLNRSK